MDILIIKLGAIGDVIRTTCILSGLKDKYPGCSIDWATKKISADILKNNNFVRDIILSDVGRLDIKTKYDLVISLDDDACELASSIDAKKIIGAYLKDGKKAYTADSSLWFDMGLISKFGKEKADILKAKNQRTYQEIIYEILGIEYSRQEPILELGKKENEFAKSFARKNKILPDDILIGINTGAGGRWQDKRLSEQETASLIDELGKKNNISNGKIKLVLFGGPEETERNNRIKKLTKADLIDAGCNNSLMEFASLVNLCNAVVTSDSLALHIATALKKKIAVFFYPTSAAEIELYGRGMKIIAKGKSYCSYKPKCDYAPKWDIKKIADSVKNLIN